jgi:hypothetical protein
MLLSIILQERMDSMRGMQDMPVAFIIIYLAFIIFMIASMWKIFTKASQPGWAILIPIYNAIVFFRVIGRPATWLFVYIGCAVLYGIGLSMIMSGNMGIGGLLTFIGFITILVISVIDYNRLSRSFGKGPGFTVGLVLLGIIFFPILAFSDAKYMGPNGVGGSAVDSDPNTLHS